jgi:sugar transferase (PEP-CTERM/EpsH1 system associated)
MSWIYQRESRLMLEWERRVAREFNWSAFISDAEAADFRRMAPESAHKVATLSNGVDADYFSPQRDYPNPYPADAKTIVFTGAMDYFPNVDAVEWFAREVMPPLRQRWPGVLFYIVGGKPSPKVQALAGDDITVTGRVEDVRPYLAHATAVTAPLRIARGIQNKVLEGMAMARTVITSPQGLEGIDAEPGIELLTADTPSDYLDRFAQVLAGLDLGGAARARILQDYAWPARLAPLASMLEGRA